LPKGDNPRAPKGTAGGGRWVKVGTVRGGNVYRKGDQVAVHVPKDRTGEERDRKHPPGWVRWKDGSWHPPSGVVVEADAQGRPSRTRPVRDEERWRDSLAKGDHYVVVHTIPERALGPYESAQEASRIGSHLPKNKRGEPQGFEVVQAKTARDAIRRATT
jgi:hypothetical protein